MRPACIKLTVRVRRVHQISLSNGFRRVITHLHEVKPDSSLFISASAGMDNAGNMHGAALHISSFPSLSLGDMFAFILKPTNDEAAALGLSHSV